MSSIKFTFDVKKIAVLKTPAGPMKVGDVVEITEDDKEKTITVKFNSDLDRRIKEKLEKDPQVMSIVAEAGMPRNIIILPGIEIPRT